MKTACPPSTELAYELFTNILKERHKLSFSLQKEKNAAQQQSSSFSKNMKK